MTATILKKALVLDPGDPLPAARIFLDRRYTRDRSRTLLHWAGEFYAWNGARYEAADLQSIRGEIYGFLEAAHRPAGKGHSVPFQPTATKVNNVVDALRATSNVSSSMRPPVWVTYTPDCCPAPSEILACANGLLHLPTGELQAPTPAFFSTTSLDFAYQPDAPEPAEWLKFLRQLWPDDPQSIEALQLLFGYYLTDDTRQQKIGMMVGPKRSGKGTIARVLTGLLGETSVCAPTLASLGSPFGLAPLIGKRVAIIADARLGGRADQQVIAERLLSISGEDSLTVDRKYLEPWTGRLPTRFLVLTNELPRIADASGALASRFMVLMLNNSFIGREDHFLTDRLLLELPAILNWAIAGWRRLRERGRLLQPASAAEAIQELEDLGSPIGAFLRDRCRLGPECEVACSRLFEVWKAWCQANNRDHLGTVQAFGRDLRAAVPGLRTANRRVMGEFVRFFFGVEPL